MLNPSDRWPTYTDSSFDARHLTPKQKKNRTSGTFITLANICKVYVGIAFISVPKSVQQAGLYGFIIPFFWTVISTIFSVVLLVKARNRFKSKDIVDLTDLGAVLYGEGIRPWLQVLLILTNSIALIAYTMFFGFTSDQLLCKTFKVAECKQ